MSAMRLPQRAALIWPPKHSQQTLKKINHKSTLIQTKLTLNKAPFRGVLVPSLHVLRKTEIITRSFHITLHCVWQASKPCQEEYHHKSLRHKGRQIVLLVCEGLEKIANLFTVLLGETKDFKETQDVLMHDSFTIQCLFSSTGSWGCLGNGSN